MHSLSVIRNATLPITIFAHKLKIMKKLIIAVLTIMSVLPMKKLSAQQDRFSKIEKNTMEGTKYGIKDAKTNSEIIPAIYDDIGDYSFGRFVVVKDSKIGVVDTSNKLIIPLEYSFISNYVNDRTFLSKNSKVAMADENGKILTSFIYDDILGYSDGVIKVVQNQKIGYISKLGKEILPCKFSQGEDCNGDFIVIYSKEWQSLGYTVETKDINGNVINKQDVGMTGNVPAVFNKRGELIYKGQSGERIKVTPNGKLAIADLYQSGMKDRRYIAIQSNGDIQEPQFYSKLSIEKYWIKIKANDGRWKYGIMSFSGAILLKPNFSAISDYIFNNDELAKVEFPNGFFFYIDKTAECVVFENQGCPE